MNERNPLPQMRDKVRRARVWQSVTLAAVAEDGRRMLWFFPGNARARIIQALPCQTGSGVLPVPNVRPRRASCSAKV